ncbi:PH domain-containing protein [Microbacterium sp.]|uniref:PH domain-containing protein n=1 Tax=Microbacterium sp. TaxID=51671 RepID=UPI003342BBD4
MNGLALDRLPLRSVLAAELHGAPALGGLALAAVVLSTSPAGVFGAVALPLIGVLAFVRLVHPVVEFATFRYRVLGGELHVEKGIWVRRRTVVLRGRIVACERLTPWSYRLLGLSVVTLHTGGEGTDEGRIELTGVDDDAAGRLAAFSRTVGPPALDDGDVVPTPPTKDPDDEQAVYRATAAQLLLAGAAQGQIVVLGAAAAFGVIDDLESLGIWRAEAPGSGIWLAPLLVPVALVAGTLLTLVRFHGFTVIRRGGEVIVRHGLIERRERVLVPSAIVGIRAHRNAIEMVLDRVRVQLLSQETSTVGAGNVILPSLPRSAVREALSALGLDLPAPPLLSEPGLRAAVRAAVVACAIVGPATASVLVVSAPLRLPAVVSVLGVLLLSAMLLSAARLFSRRIAFVDGLVHARESHVFDRADVVRITAVHQVSAASCAGIRARIVGVRYFAGVPRAFLAMQRSTAVASGVASALETVAPDIARRRRREGRVGMTHPQTRGEPT